MTTKLILNENDQVVTYLECFDVEAIDENYHREASNTYVRTLYDSLIDSGYEVVFSHNFKDGITRVDEWLGCKEFDYRCGVVGIVNAGASVISKLLDDLTKSEEFARNETLGEWQSDDEEIEV